MSGVTRILVVDDEPGIRFFLEDTLTRDGYQVTAVETGEAAVRAIAVQEFDLALVDLKLTGMGGMEVLAYLRQQSPDTAVILLTAHASLDTAVQALRQGAHDYLFKPCKTVELRESVRTGLLRRQQGRRQACQALYKTSARPAPKRQQPAHLLRSHPLRRAGDSSSGAG
jgi:DNA-binding response OmpR family regulator